MICTIALAVSVYAVSAGLRSHLLYHAVKETTTGWLSDIYRPDATLGISGDRGKQTRMSYRDIRGETAQTDNNGYRIASSVQGSGEKKDKMLFIGDSFTFGVYVAYDRTYAARVAGAAGARAVNTGLCGAGLAQMVLIAEREIPRSRPSAVVVQYSPWLVERAGQYTAPYTGAIAVPYISKGRDGNDAIHSPLFEMQDKFGRYAAFSRTPGSFSDFLKFVVSAKAPLSVIRDDASVGMARLGIAAGIIPAPEKDYNKRLVFAYSRIRNISDRFGARMIVVTIGGRHDRAAGAGAKSATVSTAINGLSALESIDGIHISDAHRRLVGEISPAKMRDYEAAYCHWYRGEEKPYDCHPNNRAHAIIAAEIVKTMKEMKQNLKTNPVKQ